jgi:hypothetical protein
MTPVTMDAISLAGTTALFNAASEFQEPPSKTSVQRKAGQAFHSDRSRSMSADERELMTVVCRVRGKVSAISMPAICAASESLIGIPNASVGKRLPPSFLWGSAR